MEVSCIFDKEPEQWGLRGDPFLWRELKGHFRQVDMPETPAQLQQLIEQAYEQATGHPITDHEEFGVERFRSHGMSSGFVSPEFWVTSGIPLLVSRHVRP